MPAQVTAGGRVEPIGRAEVLDRVCRAVIEGQGALIRARPGRGCTTVLDAAARRLGAAGHRVIALDVGGTSGAVGRSPARQGRASADGAGVVGHDLSQAVDALAGPVPAGDGPAPVVVVDGIQAADPVTVAAVHQAVTSGRVRLLAGVREPVEAIDASDGRAELRWPGDVDRIDLAPLDRRASDDLVESLAGGPVDAATRDLLWNLARGHPAWIVAAVTSTRDEHRWVTDAGLLRLPPEAATLVDPDVLRSVAALSAAARAALEGLALAGRLPIDAAEALEGAGPLTEAERRGLVRAESSDDGLLWVEPASRLVAEAVGAPTPDLAVVRWSRIADVLADPCAGDGPAPPEVTVIRGRAILGAERGEPPVASVDRDALVAGARASELLCRWDDAVAQAGAAWRAGAGDEALGLLGVALGQIGDHAAVDDLDGELDQHRDDPKSVVALTQAIAASRFHDGRVHEAWETLARGRSLVPSSRGPLDAFEAQLRAFGGEWDEAMRLARGWADDPTPEVAVTALNVIGAERMSRGDHTTAAHTFARALDLALGAGQAPLTLAGIPFLFGLANQADSGDLDGSIEAAIAALPEVGRTGDATAHGWTAVHLGRCHLAAGRPRQAARWFGEAVADLRQVHRPGWSGLATAGLVGALATAEDLDGARDALAEHESLADHAVTIFRADELRWTARLMAAEGDRRGARARLRDAVDAARRSAGVVAEAAAWHDLERFGRDADVRETADALDGLRATSTSRLVAAHADRAAARADEDAGGLVRAARTYAEIGAHGDALETWLLVGSRTDDEREIALARREATASAARTELPGRLAPHADDGHRVLTAREQEVAELVVGGASRAAIAERLVVSVRTVDSHLQRAYRKLGVRSRVELAAALGDRRETGPVPPRSR